MNRKLSKAPDLSEKLMVQDLTWRETEILRLLGDHLSDREIAAKLSLAVPTVKWYVRQILGKMGVANRRQAVLHARELWAKPPHPEDQSLPSQSNHNLPTPQTSFIGRKEQLEHIRHFLSDPARRLVTLTGSGGVGKSRLAFRAAEEVVRIYPDGIWVVELAALADANLVVQAVAAIFKVQEGPVRTLADSLVDYLRSRHLLLLLDNCEHLIESCAWLADHLLKKCQNITILATSREALGVSGETVFRVPSLSFPSSQEDLPLDEMAEYESTRLFLDRAQLKVPGFQLTHQNAASIAQICRRLDGIPLALELAAARVNLLTVEQMAARLDENFSLLTGGSRVVLPRYQTMRASIEWSYRMLPLEEQTLLNQLAVFSGGWTLEAAEAICSLTANTDPLAAFTDYGAARNEPIPSLNSPQIFDLLSQLANKSLVIAEASQGKVARYTLLEMVRQHAYERLAESGEEEQVRDRHLAYFTRFTEEIEPRLRTAWRLEGHHRLEAEFANLRAAMEWSLNDTHPGRTMLGMRLVLALQDFWYVHGLSKEGFAWLKKGEAQLDWKDLHCTIRFHAKVIYAEGVCNYHLGARSSEMIEESTALYRQAGDPLGLAESMSFLAGAIAFETSDYSKSRDNAQKALEIARTAGDPWVIAWALYWLAHQYYDDSEVAASSYYEESIQLFQETGDRWSSGAPLRGLGSIAVHRGEYDTARTYLLRDLELAREIGNQTGLAENLTCLGDAAYAAGRYTEMEAYFTSSREQYLKIGFVTGALWSLCHMGTAARRQGDAKRAARFFMDTIHEAKDREEQTPGCLVFAFEAIESIAGMAVEKDELVPAARLFGAVEASICNSSCEGPHKKAERERELPVLRARLDEKTFQVAWDEGSRLNLEQDILEAQNILNSIL